MTEVCRLGAHRSQPAGANLTRSASRTPQSLVGLAGMASVRAERETTVGREAGLLFSLAPPYLADQRAQPVAWGLGWQKPRQV